MLSITGLTSEALTKLLNSIAKAPTTSFNNIEPKVLNAAANNLVRVAKKFEEEEEEKKLSLKPGKVEPPPLGFDKDKIDEWLKTPKVAIVSKTSCPYCTTVKQLFNDLVKKDSVSLEDTDVSIWEIDLDMDMGKIQAYMKDITGGRSVPRVFVDGKFIGGCDDTMELHKNGKLLDLLK